MFREPRTESDFCESIHSRARAKRVHKENGKVFKRNKKTIYYRRTLFRLEDELDGEGTNVIDSLARLVFILTAPRPFYHFNFVTQGDCLRIDSRSAESCEEEFIDASDAVLRSPFLLPSLAALIDSRVDLEVARFHA